MRQGLKFRPGLSKEGLGFFSKEYGDCSFERLKPFENRNDMNKQVLEILKSCGFRPWFLHVSLFEHLELHCSLTLSCGNRARRGTTPLKA